MWDAIKSLALELLHEDPRYRGETEASLLEWVLDTGYRGAREPHRCTRDLLYVYAASLRNAGAPGPGFESFATMVATASESFIVDNAIVEVGLPALAQRCGAYLDDPQSMPLTVGGTRDYRDQLRQIAGGGRINGLCVLQTCLDSLVAFIRLLHRGYAGSAQRYHEAFAGVYLDAAPNPFVVEKFREVGAFAGVGVAVAMNFFKDSQVPGFRDCNLDDVRHRHVGWFVKPDRHVLRLMLHATGRAAAGGINLDRLLELSDGDAAKAYASLASTLLPDGAYRLPPERSGRKAGYWRCIEDVHLLATRDRVAPLGFDRLLYLVGSGRYKHPKERLNVAQRERYNRFIQAIDAPRAGGGPLAIAIGPRAQVTAVAAAPHEPQAMPAADEGPLPAVDCFFASIDGSPQAHDLVTQLTALCEDVHVQVHYTYTGGGDLRVRAGREGPKPLEQNVITMRWLSTRGHFSCQALEPPAQCIESGLPPECVRQDQGPLSARITVRPGIDDEALLAIARSSIDRFRGH